MVSSCEHGNEHSVSIKGEEFLDKMRNYLFLKNDSCVWDWLFISLSVSQSFT